MRLLAVFTSSSVEVCTGGVSRHTICMVQYHQAYTAALHAVPLQTIATKWYIGRDTDRKITDSPLVPTHHP